MKFSGTFVITIWTLFLVTTESRNEKARTAILGEAPVKPAKCYGTDELLDPRCCILPPFFALEIAKECGAITKLDFIRKDINVTASIRFGLNCKIWRCILQKYRLLSDGRVDEEKFYNHLDRWVKLNPEFKESIFKAKVLCKENYRAQMPLEVCEYSRYQGCLRNYVKIDCPLIINTTICNKQKAFYDQCREFFTK